MPKSALGAITLAVLLMTCPMLAQEEKAVRDSFTGTMTGTVLFVSDTVPGSTPIRHVILQVAPFREDLVALCVGSKAVADCGKLRVGRKASLSGVMSPVDDACNAGADGLAVVYALSVSKVVPR